MRGLRTQCFIRQLELQLQVKIFQTTPLFWIEKWEHLVISSKKLCILT